MPWKSIVKRCFRSVGLDLRRYAPESFEDARFLRKLRRHNINLVFDVGANTGQFARALRNSGFNGRIISFEPISAAWEELSQVSRSDSLWEVAPRAAIGERDGEVEIHVSGNSFSSSLLSMLDSHVEALPSSSYVRTERVPMLRLDNIGPQYFSADSVLFIKIDTQGYESQVLQGAERVLERTVGLKVELSLSPLYDGQSLYREIAGDLEAKGFEIWDIAPAFVDPHTERLLQIDATFFRSESIRANNPGRG